MNTIEEVRNERLRNLISPMFILSDILDRVDLNNLSEKDVELIINCKNACNNNKDFIKVALDLEATIEELKKLYHE